MQMLVNLHHYNGEALSRIQHLIFTPNSRKPSTRGRFLPASLPHLPGGCQRRPSRVSGPSPRHRRAANMLTLPEQTGDAFCSCCAPARGGGAAEHPPSRRTPTRAAGFTFGRRAVTAALGAQYCSSGRRVRTVGSEASSDVSDQHPVTSAIVQRPVRAATCACEEAAEFRRETRLGRGG